MLVLNFMLNPRNRVGVMRTDCVTGENFRQVRRKYSDNFLTSLAKEGKNVEWWILEQMSLPLDQRAPIL